MPYDDFQKLLSIPAVFAVKNDIPPPKIIIKCTRAQRHKTQNNPKRDKHWSNQKKLKIANIPYFNHFDITN